MVPVSTTPRVLVVDDERLVSDLLTSFLTRQGFACESCGDAEAALAKLAAARFDLVISDVNMPGRSGLELVRAVRHLQPQIAILMATAANDAHTAVDALRAGAVDYLIKPLELRKVLEAVQTAIERQRRDANAVAQREATERQLAERTQELNAALARLQTASTETLQALAIALDVRASSLAGHSMRVGRYAVQLAMEMGYSEEEQERLARASWLHDIGKLGVPDAVLKKPGPLTAEESLIMRSHVQIGYDLVRQVPSLAEAAELVLTHQERWDGNGYPQGLKGNQIPRDARVFAVADALDAMTSDRPYRPTLNWEQARAEIVAEAGRYFDPAVVAAFERIPLARWATLQRASVKAAHANERT